jgi:hypothetical protein
MGSVVMTYTPSLIKIGSVIHEEDTHTDGM